LICFGGRRAPQGVVLNSAALVPIALTESSISAAIRRVRREKHINGYTYLYLVETVREDGRAKQRIIKNLGRKEAVPRLRRP
jgi:hypothetical protein